MNFVITAMGRSGTLAMAAYLNQSPTWTVEHEPESRFQPVRELQVRFDRDHYGEVNSFLRFAILPLRVDRKMIIIRDPMEIFQSMVNRGRPRLSHLVESLYCLDAAIQAGVEPVSFSATIEKPWRVAAKVGVTDVPRKPLAKKNESQPAKMSYALRDQAIKELAWFRREYAELI